MAIKSFRAPAASDYSAKIGYVVYKSGTANEVTISTDPTQAAECPVGVIIACENDATGGQVTVAMAGEHCYARAGAAITLGTHNLLKADGDGEVVPATANTWAVGYTVHSVTAADNDLIEIVVAPSWYEA